MCCVLQSFIFLWGATVSSVTGSAMVPALKRVEDILKWMAHPKNMNRVPVKGPNDGMKGYVCERELGKFRAVAKKMRDRGIEPAPGSPIAILNELFKGFDNKWYMQSPRVGKVSGFSASMYSGGDLV